MLDQLCGYIQQKFIELGLDKRVNIVHLSDHGMASVSPPNFIDLRKFLTNGTYTTYGTSPILQIVPKSACEFDLLINLAKFVKKIIILYQISIIFSTARRDFL